MEEKFSLFQNLHAYGSRTVGWDEIVRLVRHDDGVRRQTEVYRKMQEALGKPEADEKVKRKTAAFAVPVRFDGSGRQALHVVEFTGVGMVDIDHMGEADIKQAERNIKNDPHTLLCYTTLSGRGLRILYRYRRKQADAPLDATTWPAAFLVGNRYYARLTGCDYDPQCSDYTRISVLAHDPEAYYNPEAEPLVVRDEDILQVNFADPANGGQPGAEHPAGTHHATMALAWPRVERMLAGKQLAFVPGRHHDYVMHAAFLCNRFGVEEKDLMEWARQEWSAYSSTALKGTIRSCYRKTQEHGTWPLWPKGRQGRAGGTGEAAPTKAELIVSFLRKQPLRYDVLSRRIQMRMKNEERSMKNEEERWVDVSDRMANDLLYECNRQLGQNISKTTFLPMLMSAQVPEVNPLRDYVMGLPQWDGQTDYIGQVAAMVHTGSPELWQRCFRKWLVAMVASWMRDDAVNHQVLVLIGPQGIYKTSWLDALMPPQLAQYRSKQSSAGRLDKDELLRATEFGLINLDEIDRMTESELNQLKSLITSVDVNVRSPYAYGKERRLRVASYVASGNKERFLTDQTGNRRWLPFRVEAIDSPFEHPLPYEGLYAQAWHLVEEGFNYWFDLQEIRQMEEHVDEFMVETSEAQLLPVYFRPCEPGTPGAQLLSVAEISARLTLWGNIRRPMDIRQLGVLLRKQGYVAKRSTEGRQRGYLVLEYSAEVVNANRKLLAR